jgi:hypothetical protein
VCALNLHCRSECRELDGLIDLEDYCLQMVALRIASREIPHIAMVALQECLPEGNGMQLDLGNQNLFRDHRIQRECIGRQERRRIGEPVLWNRVE